MSRSEHWQPLLKFVEENQCDWSLEPPIDDSSESTGQWGIHQLDDPPHNRLLGPVFARGGPAGLIQRNGETLCTWGDIGRADMTFSVTKTYLALTAGVAYDRGLLPDLDSPIVDSLPGIGFDSEQNATVTWRHLMQFTSEWEGSCFGVPDQIDHYRYVGFQPNIPDHPKGQHRQLQNPGKHWEYNDVRMNQFSLALMHLFERPLPEVFRESILDVLGASPRFAWLGYENSWVEVAGKSLQSVPGGGHWGGGVVISASDQALVSSLLVNGGKAGDRQIVSREWIDLMLRPCDIAPFYGFFTWLNTGHAICKSASVSSFFALGIGGQLIWHDPDQSVVAVFRWLGDDCTEDLITLVNRLLSE